MAIQAYALADLDDLLDLPAGTTVSLTGPGAATAISTSTLAHFAGSASDPFLILSSGLAANVTNANTAGNQGTDHSPSGVSGDTITLTLTIPKPVNASAFSFDFTFLSEEYPEYVGSAYNDFLSVKVNGVEAALDTGGKPITVNNNFFTNQYTPTGTMFDGQTPPLTITVGIPQNTTSIDVVIQLSDVGDGIYDSAAFLKNFHFVEPQIVYLQFGAGSIEFESFFGDDTLTLPGSGLSTAQQDQVIASLNAIYGDFLIQFTRTAPTSGEYSTIHVGGKVANLPTKYQSSGLLGQAEDIDYGNKDKSDAAFVLTGEMALINGAANLGLISQVIAHEAGHILGLRHVEGSAELMYPYAGAGSTTIGGAQNLAEIDDNGLVKPVGGTQNSHEELERNLGLKNSSKLVESESYFKKILKFFNLDFNSTFTTLHDVVAVVATADNEVLSYVQLGDLSGKGGVNFQLPAAEGDKVILLGKSSANGGYDVFMTPGGVASFDLDSAGQASILDTLGVNVSSVTSGNFSLLKADTNGNLSAAGSVKTLALPVTDSGATEGADTLAGADGVDDTIAGLGGEDLIRGLSGKDRLFGDAGDDQLEGGADADTLEGGADDDRLDGGTGADLMRGGTGNDRYIVDDAGDQVIEFTGEGTDTVESAINFSLAGLYVENLTLTGATAMMALGNSYANALTGNSAANWLVGQGGNDRLDGGANIDMMVGGTGDDSYVVSDAGDMVVEEADQGADTVEAWISYALTDHVETLLLLGQAANGTGNALANRIVGTAMANTLDGAGGADRMEGGDGTDRYYVDDAGDRVIELAGQGNDDEIFASVTFELGANVEHLNLTGIANTNGGGNALNNRIVGSDGANWLAGAAGNDTLDGGIGADRMDGGLNDDTYFVDNVGDRVNEKVNEGADWVYTKISFELSANVEYLVLQGTENLSGAGNALANTITGNSGANWLVGAGGGDTLNGLTGGDRMEGGLGDDIYYVDSTGDRVIEKLGEGSDFVISSISFELGDNVEQLVLSGTADLNGAGNALANTLSGNSGNNWLVGGAGNDVINGGTGGDRMEGGLNDDTYYVDSTLDRVNEKAGEGTDLVYSTISYELGATVENLTLIGLGSLSGGGNALANMLTGGDGNNWLVGAGGNDVIDGGLGGDRMEGGANDDTYYVDNAGDRANEKANEGIDTVYSSIAFELGANVEHLRLIGTAGVSGAGNDLANAIYGNSGANWLVGAGGADLLDGGLGVDRYDGGAGADVFAFSTALGGGNIDTIRDFVVADDTIQLHRSIFTGIAANGVLAAGALRLGTAALDADDRILYDAATGNLWYDADGVGGTAAVQFAKMTAGLALTNADFFAVA